MTATVTTMLMMAGCAGGLPLVAAGSTPDAGAHGGIVPRQPHIVTPRRVDAGVATIVIFPAYDGGVPTRYCECDLTPGGYQRHCECEVNGVTQECGPEMAPVFQCP